LTEFILGSLILAWILSLFGVEEFFIRSVHELFDKDVTIATYYILFLAIGFIFGTLDYFRNW
jgi:hypothetical protein